MTSPYYYVYVLFLSDNTRYIGYRTSKVHPKDDLLIKYKSSSRIVAEKLATNTVKGRVLGIFKTKEDAYINEQWLIYYYKTFIPNHRLLNGYYRINRDGESEFKIFRNSGKTTFKPGTVSVNKGKRGEDTSCYNKKMYNNGNVQKFYIPGTQPADWILGRLNKPWNYGLTAEDNEKVALGRDKQRVSLKARYDSGDLINPNKGITLSEDRKAEISISTKEGMAKIDPALRLLQLENQKAGTKRYFEEKSKQTSSCP